MQAAEHLLQGLPKNAATAAAVPTVSAAQRRRKQCTLHGCRKLGLCCWAAPRALLAWATAAGTGQASSCRRGCRCTAGTTPAAPCAKPASPEAPAALLLLSLCCRLCRFQLPETALQARLGFRCRCGTPVLLLLLDGFETA